jgi:hypothetical protein
VGIIDWGQEIGEQVLLSAWEDWGARKALVSLLSLATAPPKGREVTYLLSKCS